MMLESQKKLELIGRGTIQISSRGVPHLVYRNKSVCWFKTGNFYRVFEPYPVWHAEQFRTDCKTPEEVLKVLLK